jgi:hypothetical protein
VRQDWHLIQYSFIQSSINAGRKDLAKLAADSILLGYDKKDSDFPDSHLEYIRSILTL